MNFNEVYGEIHKSIEEKKQAQAQSQAPASAQPQSAATTVVGTIVSKPGTERVVLDASTFQFMECETAATGFDKKRFCIVEKGTPARYPNQFVTSAGDRAHIVTREVYTLMLGVINNVSKQLRQLSGDLALAKEKTELYKMTIDALRKNGIIE